MVAGSLGMPCYWKARATLTLLKRLCQDSSQLSIVINEFLLVLIKAEKFPVENSLRVPLTDNICAKYKTNQTQKTSFIA